MIHQSLAQTLPPILAAILATICSLIIIISYYRFRELQTLFLKMILILAYYDLAFAIGFLFCGSYIDFLCKFQAVWLAFFFVTLPIWKLAVSVFIYLKVSSKVSNSNIEKLLKYFLFGTIPFLIIFVALLIPFTDTKRNDSAWCYVEPYQVQVGFYIVVWVCLISVLVFFVLIIVAINRFDKTISEMYSTRNKQREKEKIKIQTRMTLVPIIYILSYIPSTIKRGIEFSNNSNPISLDILQAATMISQGIWDFLIYIFLDQKIRRCVFSMFCKKYHENQSQISLVKTESFENETVDENETIPLIQSLNV
ncbi:g protein-coupled receptor [Anaeramoeba ignava]|uniref:G protein-coupled receptor n=1 Tax=Anaeramoeba ignava TaxID=1746090 RepID=A0A9Q0RG01_ANAIG|nr:g protein-coupled receptor [Anaeramoeba ignava]